MSRYLTFAEYQVWGGSKADSAFERLAFRAASAIDRATFGRLQQDPALPEPVKRLMFELIELYGNADAAAADYAPAPVSERNDGYSVDYGAESVLTPKKVEALAAGLIREYLAEVRNGRGEYLLCQWA